MEESKVRQLWGRAREALSSPYARKVVIQLASFFGGMCCSRGLVFGRFAPFGVAAAASVPREGMWAAVLGAFLGYLLPSPVFIPVRYEAALLAVAAIRWSLSELKSVTSHVLFPPIAAFLPLLLTGMTMVFLNGSHIHRCAVRGGILLRSWMRLLLAQNLQLAHGICRGRHTADSGCF